MHMEIQEPGIFCIVMRKKTKVGKFILPDFKTGYKTIIINQCG